MTSPVLGLPPYVTHDQQTEYRDRHSLPRPSSSQTVTLSSIPANLTMSLSRSPSPHPGGGWTSPGLTPGSGASAPRGYSPSPASLAPGAITWAAAKAKSDEVRGYPSFSTRNSGFFSRQKHKISAQLPSFRRQRGLPYGYVDKDVYGRAHWRPGRPDGRGFLRRFLRRGRARFVLGLVLLWLAYLCFWSCKCERYAGPSVTEANLRCSNRPSIPSLAARRRPQIRDYPRLECGGWRDGVEGCTRVGHRAQQHLE